MSAYTRQCNGRRADRPCFAETSIALEEIEDEARWNTASARSPDMLERLAAEAEEEDRQGLTEELDPDAS